MKKHLFLLILISPLFFTACSFPGSNKIPETVPPAIVIPEKEDQILDQVQDDKDSENIEVSENKALKYEVILPSEERETERLMEEYQAILENIESNLE